jgi:hypothetical protein
VQSTEFQLYQCPDRSPVHCVALSNDDLLYVCDRQSDAARHGRCGRLDASD